LRFQSQLNTDLNKLKLAGLEKFGFFLLLIRGVQYTKKAREIKLGTDQRLMPQMKNAGQLSQSSNTQAESKRTTGSTTQSEKSKNNTSTDVGSAKDGFRISPGLKTLATTTFATNVAQQRALLTKKPEGIQISRSKHWKFISSYHGP